jgi:peptidoglycan-N-acetylglucosamine deacetylase
VPRRRPITIAGLGIGAVALLAVAIGSCSGSEVNGVGPDVGPTSTLDPDLGARVAASASCAIAASCMDAVERTYGLRVRDLAVTLPDRRATAEGLARGVLDVAITTADDPYLGGSVLLADDLGAFIAETVVPVVNAAALELADETIRTALGNVGRVLDTAALTDLRAAVEVERRTPGEAAALWLAGTGLADGSATTGVASLSVGHDESVRSQLLAEVFARTLTSVGLATTVTPVAGGSAGLLGALEDGQIAMAPALAGTWLEVANGFAGEASADADQTLTALTIRLAERDLVVLERTAAVAAVVVAVDGDLAQRAGFASIGDLAALPGLNGATSTSTSGVDGATIASQPSTTSVATASDPPSSNTTGAAPDDADPTTGTSDPTADTGTDQGTDAGTEPGVDEAPPQLPPALTARRAGWGVGASAPEVVVLQDRLRAAGFGTTSSGTVDEATRRAIRAAQRALGILPDGVATPSLLDAMAGGIGTPPPFPRPGDEDLPDPPAELDRRPVVYLTVEGGPDPVWTPRLLDLLDRSGAEATFFIDAFTAAHEQELVRRVAARGHGIGATTGTYAPFSAASRGQATREVAAARATLQTITGSRVPCVRLPSAAWLEPAAARTSIAGEGAVVIGDDVDPQDLRRPSPTAMVRSLEVARPGDVLVVHDGQGDRTTTLTALENALQSWSARGWRAAALPACVPVPLLPPPAPSTTAPLTTADVTTADVTTAPVAAVVETTVGG